MEYSENENALNEAQASRYLGLSVSTLRSWRSQRREIAFVRAGRRVLYARESLDRFLRENEVQPEVRG